MKEREFYHVAVYLRLSRDDGELATGRTESNSICSQRDLIDSFIQKHRDMAIYDTYVDDGWSGVDFNRPGFKRMMKDIEAGHVNCIIVKDLSRLGRDYIEAGRLIQRTFPAFSVRFIAITDDFDTLTADYNETSLVLPMKNFVNDSYCRDISAKVRSHQRIKRERGEFIGAFCVYGYKRSEENRHILIPDAYAADIVRQIFFWKLEGYSANAIAKRLNQWGILSPMEYKKHQGENFRTGFPTGVTTKWSAVAVKRILVNEVYMGNLVQGKEERINYKIKKNREKPKEEWVRVENTHAAIVSKEDFAIVQELLQVEVRPIRGEKRPHLYSGLLFCGDCKAPMVRRVIRYKGRDTVHFICATCNQGSGCSRHDITEEALGNVVKAGIRIQMLLGFDSKEWAGKVFHKRTFNRELANRELQKLYQEQARYVFFRTGLYEDFKNHILSDEEYQFFQEIYEKRYYDLQEIIEKQEGMMEEYGLWDEPVVKIQKKVEEIIEGGEPDRMAILSFVKRILIYEDKRVYLEFRCGNPFHGQSPEQK